MDAGAQQQASCAPAPSCSRTDCWPIYVGRAPSLAERELLLLLLLRSVGPVGVAGKNNGTGGSIERQRQQRTRSRLTHTEFEQKALFGSRRRSMCINEAQHSFAAADSSSKLAVPIRCSFVSTQMQNCMICAQTAPATRYSRVVVVASGAAKRTTQWMERGGRRRRSVIFGRFYYHSSGSGSGSGNNNNNEHTSQATGRIEKSRAKMELTVRRLFATGALFALSVRSLAVQQQLAWRACHSHKGARENQPSGGGQKRTRARAQNTPAATTLYFCHSRHSN